jgi:folate-binding protein YgfZ
MRSPVAGILEQLSAVFGGPNEQDVPIHFGDWQAEYQAAIDAVAIFDCSTMTKVEISGRDHVRFVNNLCTNDIKRLGAGSGCEAFFTTAQGKILFFVRVFAGSESIWIDTVRGCAAALLAHLERYHITEQVEMADRSADYGQFLLIGPNAMRCLSSAGKDDLPPLSELGHAATDIAGHRVSLMHNDALAQPAIELRVPVAAADAVWSELWRAGLPLGLRPIGATAFEAVRIESGWPIYGRDIDQSNLPQEVGRNSRAISFTKGCYLGQETVARIDALGHVNRHLIGLELKATEPPVAGCNVDSGGRTVGQVTSSAYSPSRGHAIALGYVRRGFDRPGAELMIQTQGGPVPAAACALPFAKQS